MTFEVIEIDSPKNNPAITATLSYQKKKWMLRIKQQGWKNWYFISKLSTTDLPWKIKQGTTPYQFEHDCRWWGNFNTDGKVAVFWNTTNWVNTIRPLTNLDVHEIIYRIKEMEHHQHNTSAEYRHTGRGLRHRHLLDTNNVNLCGSFGTYS